MSEHATSVRARLTDPEPEVRRLATQELPTLPAPESCELLVLALGDADWRVRKEAATVAVKIEPRTAVVFSVANALAERDDIGLRNAAVEALVAIGPDSVPGAINALARLDPDGRKLAVEVLAGIPTLAGVRALIRAMKDPDVNVVVAVAEALGNAHLAGDEARELATRALSDLLAHAEVAPRLAALESLRNLDVEVPWSRLEPLFGDALLRRNAIAAAGGSRTPRAIVALAEAIADANPTLARDATIALGRSLEATWGEEELADVAAKTLRSSNAARSRLRSLAKDAGDPAARGAAILALGLVRDPDDVSVIADALADDAVADRAEAALRLFGEDAIEPMLAIGKSAAPSIRGATISMLPQLAPRESEPLAAVREALSEGAPEVLAPALKSLAIVGAPEDLEPVSRHVAHPDPKVAGAAQAALHAIAAKHVREARALLADADPRGDRALVAAVVMDALARAGAAQPGDAAFLAEALTHREAKVRRAAIEALASIGGDDAAQAVSFSLADEESVVALAAIRALGRLGRAEQLASLAATTKDPLRLGTVLRALREADPERAFAAARPLLRAQDPSIAAAAVDVVGAIDVQGRVEALMGAVDHADHEVVKLALARLASTSDERALVALVRAIDHAAAAVRKYAAELLGAHARQEGVEGILRSRLDRERSADVRAAIMQALAARPPGGAGP